ncbi:MAG: DUF6089 family protein [Saprospiraceae bacterium]
MCKNSISTFILFFAFLFSMNAQNLDIGFFVGSSSYMGDLHSTHLEKNQINLAAGIIGKYRINEFLDARISYTQGTISGQDAGRNASRNLSFKSKIREVNALAEFHPLSFINGDRPIFSPYVYGGMAVFHHNPQAAYQSQWYDLQPLQTEGQDPYGLFQVAIPGGVGCHIYINDAISIGVEGGIRKTFTDYLDDVSGTYTDVELLAETNPVAAALAYRTPEYMDDDLMLNPVGSQRGNSSRNDAYWFGGVTFMINIAGLMELSGGPGIYNPF